MQKWGRGRTVATGIVAAIAAGALAGPAAAQDTRGQNASPASPFSQKKQNEPAVAIDQQHPNIVVAGANDNIDMEACNAAEDNTCPFTPGVGVSGIYFSLDSGKSWTQPTYTGLTGCDCLGVPGDSDPPCTAHRGSIGTLPRYAENDLVSDGDPALAFGPQPAARGGFSYANGSRLYYANLASAVPGRAPFKGAEAIAVSHTDNPQAAAGGSPAGAAAWSDPV